MNEIFKLIAEVGTPIVGSLAMGKIDLLVSSALELRPDIDRIARAENFIEDGRIDSRRD